MSYLLSFLFGTVLKIYDDLEDNKLLKKFKNPLFFETIKMLNTILYLVLSIKEPLFYYLLSLTLVWNLYSVPSSFKGAYEKAGIIILFVIYFFIDNSKIRFSNIDLTLLFGFCIIIVIIYIESDLSPKEFSIIKIFIRFIICISSILAFIFFKNNETISLICICAFGYMITSVMVQYYCLFISNTKIKKYKKQEKQEKQEKQKNKKNKKNKKTIK